jgi:hypothetical protein
MDPRTGQTLVDNRVTLHKLSSLVAIRSPYLVIIFGIDCEPSIGRARRLEMSNPVVEFPKQRLGSSDQPSINFNA